MEYLLIDSLSLILAGYIGILGIFILLYARKNFEREENGRKWLIWFVMTIFSVLLLILSGDYLVILLGFVLIGLCLNQLLLSFPNRERSQILAKKKFIVSRLGDLSLILSIWFFYESFQTFDILSAKEKLLFLSTEEKSDLILLPGLFLGFAALIKSAQFPFNFWLPETIEAPTPVSALMHAGIINAGGYLLVRFHFLFSMDGLPIMVIFASGMITIIMGGFSMLTQSDVKRKLAYSTLGQMGFMMVEFSLGLYSLVILHIMGHGFYKAYGFLTSGNREIAEPYPLMEDRLRTGLGFVAIFLPLVVMYAIGDFKVAILTLLSIMLLGFLPKRIWILSLILSAGLVGTNFYLQNLGDMLIGNPISGIKAHFLFEYLTVGVLSFFGGFVLILPILKNFSFYQKLYCYSQRGFLGEYYTDKIIKEAL